MIQKLLYYIFSAALLCGVLMVIAGIVSGIMRIVTGQGAALLYGHKGNIFVICIIIMVASAAISNLIDKKNPS